MKRSIVALLALVLAMLACSVGPAVEPKIVYVEVTSTPVPVPPTATPKPGIPGITEPIEIRGVELLFTDVSLMTSVKLNGNTSRPSAPYNILVVVDAEILPISSKEPCKWQGEDQVNLSWTRNGKADDNDWGICQTTSNGTARFFFASFKDAKDLTLILPGGVQVPLESLLDSANGSPA